MIKQFHYARGISLLKLIRSYIQGRRLEMTAPVAPMLTAPKLPSSDDSSVLDVCSSIRRLGGTVAGQRKRAQDMRGNVDLIVRSVALQNWPCIGQTFQRSSPRLRQRITAQLLSKGREKVMLSTVTRERLEPYSLISVVSTVSLVSLPRS